MKWRRISSHKNIWESDPASTLPICLSSSEQSPTAFDGFGALQKTSSCWLRICMARHVCRDFPLNVVFRGDRQPCLGERKRTMRFLGGLSIICTIVLILGTFGAAQGTKDKDADGRNIFRFDTFGDEQLWTDTLRMNEPLESLT